MNKITKRYVAVSIFFLVSYLQAFSTTYYISNNGADSNSGISSSNSWQTLSKVNTFSFQPGDSVLFKRGDVWRGQLIPQSGNINGHIYYGAYGTGDKPTFLGSWNISDSLYWENDSGNIWSTINSIQIPFDVGNVIFDYASSFGVKKWAETDLLQQGDYWYDTLNNKLEIFSNSNPAVFYNDIECALAYNIINQDNKSYITYENLALKYGGGHGIGGGNTNNIIIRSCDISYIGGGAMNHPIYGWVRYGNGIEFWANASNNLVERCKVWEVYDAAITNQNAGDTAIQTNIIYRNNLIYNSEWSFEYWNRPTGSLTQNIYFINNTCLYAGRTWAHAQRPIQRGRHLCFYQNEANTNNFNILNNIFYMATSANLYVLRYSDLDSFNLNYNCWYQTINDTLIDIRQGEPSYAAYTMAQFNDYKNDFQQDSASIAQDPAFVDTTNADFQLSFNSPCIDAGTTDTTGIQIGGLDFLENNRIIDGDGTPPATIDIGCYEYEFNIGVEDFNPNNTTIRVYPNPFQNLTTIEFNNPKHEKNNINVYNSIGELVKSVKNIYSNKIILNMKNFNKGIYFIELINNEETIARKKIILN